MSCVPIVNQRYTDKSGKIVTVTDVTGSRVSFTREGYEFPCIQPTERFKQSFTAYVEVNHE